MSIPNCLPGQPNIPSNPCAPVEQSLNDMVSTNMLNGAITVLLFTFAALAGVYVVMRGGSLVLSKIKPSVKLNEKKDRVFTHEEALADPDSFQNYQLNRERDTRENEKQQSKREFIADDRIYDIDDDGVIRDYD